MKQIIATLGICLLLSSVAIYETLYHADDRATQSKTVNPKENSEKEQPPEKVEGSTEPKEPVKKQPETTKPKAEEKEKLVPLAKEEPKTEETTVKPKVVVTEPKPVTVEPKVQLSSYEFDLLARLVRAEAKGEPFEGKVAVANVVLNRVEDGGFPNTVESVIYQTKQFQPVANGAINKTADTESKKAVQKAVQHRSDTESLYFFNPDVSTSTWFYSLDRTKVIGNHEFFR